MNSPLPEITVIIPTLALPARRELIHRAVESVLSQSGVAAQPLLVVNGRQFDSELFGTLRADPRLTVVTREEQSLPGAIREGRRLVKTPWFTVLDDDDALLAGALALRVETLSSHPELDVVVTNGYRRSQAGDQLHVADPRAVQLDPLRTLLETNWLLQGSWLGRTEAFSDELLEGMPDYLECTFLATLFGRAGRMRFLETPTVVWFQDTPDSLSKSNAFQFGEIDALKSIRRLPLPDWFRQGIDRKVGTACHSLAEHFRNAGRGSEAWRWHLRTLRYPGGFRYLSSTRHFIAMLFRG